MILPKTLGNLMLMLNELFVCMTILNIVTNFDFLFYLVNRRSQGILILHGFLEVFWSVAGS